MKNKFKWGIAGTGVIAHKFAKGLDYLENAEISAVCSRNLNTAEAFSKEFNIPKAYGSYEDMAKDKELDLIYIATPHIRHKEDSKLFLKNGKGVLCEKPFSMNTEELKELVECARLYKQPVMEGMWTRFMPAIVRLRELLKDKVIGDVQIITADFGFKADHNPKGRLFNKKLGGGALLDVGIYTVAFASMVMGKQPELIKAITDIGTTGVDEKTSIQFGYDTGEIASLLCSISTETPQQAVIMGTKGMITIPAFWKAEELILSLAGEKEIKINLPIEGNGYNYEAAAFMDTVNRGETENPINSLDESLEIMKTMDKIRENIGLFYS